MRGNHNQNIILFNVTVGNTPNVGERMNYDSKLARDVLKCLPFNVNTKNSEVLPLGRPTASRALRFDNVVNVHKVINNASQLRNSKRFKNVCISLDDSIWFIKEHIRDSKLKLFKTSSKIIFEVFGDTLG